MNKNVKRKSRRKKICFFTKNKIEYIDYKEFEFLGNYVNINKKNNYKKNYWYINTLPKKTCYSNKKSKIYVINAIFK